MKEILNFDQINTKNKPLVGNKAFNLSLLAKQVIKIAKFFVIINSVFEQIIKSQEIESLKEQLTLVKLSNLEKESKGVKKILQQINSRINQLTFPEDLQKKVWAGFKKLKTDKVAIRSSATCEDLMDASFAGQFESYLAVSEDEVLATIKKCWGKVFTKQVLVYCLYREVDFSTIKMAVIIQEMIFAEKGGVIFTKDVFQGREGILVIEAAKGLGERVVSGIVNPESIFISKDTGKIAQKQSGDGQVLSQREIKELTDMALEIEKFYGYPQDIEWAIEKGKIYILQSRPIT